MAQHFIKVLVPLRLDWIPTYRADAPTELGETVYVNFAGRRYTGIVWERTEEPDIPLKSIRPITSRDTSLPAVGRRTREFWAFLASYYMCTLGEVYAAALHSIEGTQQKKAAAELERLRAKLEKTSASLLGRHGERVRARLEAEAESLRKEIANTEERLQSRSVPVETPNRKPCHARPQLLVGTDRLARYAEAIQKALSPEPAASRDGSQHPLGNGLNCGTLYAGTDTAGNDAAGAPGTATFDGRVKIASTSAGDINANTSGTAGMENEGGGQVLVLSPSKAFCEKTERQLRELFADRLQTYHSGVSESARRKLSDRLRSGESLVVLGLRSALFLPFTRLTLVIIDEEQDSFYKQTEPAPRYNGRDAAIYLAKLYGADVMLGSSFPSLESLYNCKRGKYDLLKAATGSPESPSPKAHAPEGQYALWARPDPRSDSHPESPDEFGGDRVLVVDSGAELRKNGMVGHFSRKLIKAIDSCQGGAVLIRGWEKPEELLEQAVKLFKDKTIRISTLQEFKEEGPGEAKLVAVMGADAFFDKDDFRSDEKALQMVATLSELSEHLVIQTTVPERFDGSHTAESLLAERQWFNFPPFRRIVDIRKKGSREIVRRVFLDNGRSLEAQKRSMPVEADCYADVDPA